MNFGQRTPEAEAHRIVARALERGIDLFDTANVYVDGESERILGRALGKRRGQARIATKMGIGKMSDPEGLAPDRSAPPSLLQALAGASASIMATRAPFSAILILSAAAFHWRRAVG